MRRQRYERGVARRSQVYRKGRRCYRAQSTARRVRSARARVVYLGGWRRFAPQYHIGRSGQYRGRDMLSRARAVAVVRGRDKRFSRVFSGQEQDAAERYKPADRAKRQAVPRSRARQCASILRRQVRGGRRAYGRFRERAYRARLSVDTVRRCEKTQETRDRDARAEHGGGGGRVRRHRPRADEGALFLCASRNVRQSCLADNADDRFRARHKHTYARRHGARRGDRAFRTVCRTCRHARQYACGHRAVGVDSVSSDAYGG